MQIDMVSGTVKLKIFRESAWYKKRKSYRVLFWREITPLAIPLFIEGLCVMLMGVFSTLLVSWLGKEAMAAQATEALLDVISGVGSCHMS